VLLSRESERQRAPRTSAGRRPARYLLPGRRPDGDASRQRVAGARSSRWSLLGATAPRLAPIRGPAT